MRIFSRRALIGGVAGLLRAELPRAETQLRRFRDPATEFEILRYSDPAASSLLAQPHLRSMWRNNNSLLFCSDRTGKFQLWRLELKTGVARQVTDFADGVAPHSFALTRDERSASCVHGNAIELAPLGRGRVRTVYRAPGDWQIVECAPFESSMFFAVIEQRADRYRVRYVRASTADTLFEAGEAMTALRPRPRRADVLVRRGGRLSLLRQDSRGVHDVATRGRAGQALWSADGSSVIYLSFPEEKGKLNELREHFPESSEDKLIAPTSQFGTFARNGDASVFVGISTNKASPHVLLLLRTTRREMTLSEHRSSAPAEVSVLFTPDSQRVFYHSDRQGKPAIYAVPAEWLLEKTDDDREGRA
jgi:oligogalacturonide lyase